MTELERVYLEALRESSRSLQSSLLWALGTSLSLLIGVYSSPPTEGGRATVPVQGLWLSVDTAAAELLALAAFFVLGIMACFALESFRRAARSLSTNNDLLRAASVFPTIATFPSAMRVTIALTPSLLVVWAGIAHNVKSNTPSEWSALLFELAVLSAPYLVLSEMSRAELLPHLREQAPL